VAGGAPPHDAYMQIPMLTPDHPLAIQGKGETSIRVPAKWEGKKQLRLFFAEESRGEASLNGVFLGAFAGKEAVLAIPENALKWGDNEVEIYAEKAVLTDAAIDFLR